MSSKCSFRLPLRNWKCERKISINWGGGGGGGGDWVQHLVIRIDSIDVSIITFPAVSILRVMTVSWACWSMIQLKHHRFYVISIMSSKTISEIGPRYVVNVDISIYN